MSTFSYMDNVQHSLSRFTIGVSVFITDITKEHKYFIIIFDLENPDLVQLLEVGFSVKGQPILGVSVTAGVLNRTRLRPMVGS